jgi:hypothetical protein
MKILYYIEPDNFFMLVDDETMEVSRHRCRDEDHTIYPNRQTYEFNRELIVHYEQYYADNPNLVTINQIYFGDTVYVFNKRAKHFGETFTISDFDNFKRNGRVVSTSLVGKTADGRSIKTAKKNCCVVGLGIVTKFKMAKLHLYGKTKGLNLK